MTGESIFRHTHTNTLNVRVINTTKNYIYVLCNFAFWLCIYIKNISVRPPPLLPRASGFHIETLTIGGEVGGVTLYNNGWGHRIQIRDHFLYDIIHIHEILGGEAYV